MSGTFPSKLLKIGKSVWRLKNKTLKRLAQNNYYTARAYYHHRLRQNDGWYKHPPLLVYQMGKVGSSSVTESLKRAGIDRHIYHIHFLSPEETAKYEQNRRPYLSTEKEGDLKHIWQYQHLYRQIKQGLNGERWKIVTLVRDPVARNVSDFFEHIELVSAEAEQPWRLRSIEYEYELTLSRNNLKPLIDLYFEKYRHDFALTYFDEEFKRILNIDLFASDFPRPAGYKIYREKAFDVLVLKLEHLNDCFSQAFKAFLDLDGLKPVRANVSRQKAIGDIYRAFKETVDFPEAYLDRMYGSRLAQHFYSQAELSRFREKWSKKPAAQLSGPLH